jgi:hypothetical protein
MKPEETVKAAIKGWLKDHGAYFFMPVQTGYGATTLDFLVCYRGWFVGIEAKRPGIKRPSPRQLICMENIHAAGGVAICADSLESFLGQIAPRLMSGD